ncbi:MAG: hypothetical protein COB58_06950 [Thalassobium sp.]|nr:MAG: hypothetical protein COB58_06950 [Thalassobium sp.]
MDGLRALDPAKPLADIENYVYHVLQLYYMHKLKQQADEGSGGGGLDPAETELSNLSKDELWKRQTRATSYAVPVHALVRYCGRVLYRRSSAHMHSDADAS